MTDIAKSEELTTEHDGQIDLMLKVFYEFNVEMNKNTLFFALNKPQVFGILEEEIAQAFGHQLNQVGMQNLITISDIFIKATKWIPFAPLTMCIRAAYAFAIVITALCLSFNDSVYLQYIVLVLGCSHIGWHLMVDYIHYDIYSQLKKHFETAYKRKLETACEK